MSTTIQVREPSFSRTAETPKYRHDIDGLRAVAILLVVVYHVWIGRVSGGVDAFLMISAFFLTGTFVRRLERDKPLEIVGQWIRTFKRLLPPAAVTLTLTLLVGMLVIPNFQLASLFREVWASLFYVENWRLAFNATDYYADKEFASPVQHFWSLSVQGQVFLLWPILFLVVRAISQSTRMGIRSAAGIVFSLVFVASFAYSVITTATRQEFAYFDTGARIWEFAAGALLAIYLPRIRLTRPLRELLGWIGILALLSCGLVLDVQGGFPGYLALWPVLAVAAIIASGANDADNADALVNRGLAWKPVVILGQDAYGLYLVHWPILIFTIILQGGGSLSFINGLFVIVASLVAARLMTWLVDDRVRHAKWANANKRRGLLVIVLAICLTAIPTSYFQWNTQRVFAAEQAKIDALDQSVTHPGAAVLLDSWTGEVPTEHPPIPLGGDLEAEWAQLPIDCADGNFPFPFADFGASCTFMSPDAPKLSVAVIGNSHAEQWLGALEGVAEEQDWQMLAFLQGGCSLAERSLDSFKDEEYGQKCITWMDSMKSSMREFMPDVIITVGTRSQSANESMDEFAGEEEAIPLGTEEALQEFTDMGIPIVLLRDNPRFTFNSFECANAIEDAQPLESAEGAARALELVHQYSATERCGVTLSRALASTNPAEALTRPGVATVDMTDFICEKNECPAIVGNIFVYLDDNHLTTTYARTMAPMLSPRLVLAIDQARSWEWR